MRHLFLFFTLLLAAPVSAQEAAPSAAPASETVVSEAPAVESVSAGLTPASRLYFLDRWSERASLFFTFNAQKKAEKAMKFAQEKLEETRVLETVPNEQVREQVMQKALEQYEKHRTRAQEKFAEGKIKAEEKLKELEADGATQEELQKIREKFIDKADERFATQMEAHRQRIEALERPPEMLKPKLEEIQQEHEVKFKEFIEAIPEERREIFQKKFEQHREELKQQFEDERAQMDEEEKTFRERFRERFGEPGEPGEGEFGEPPVFEGEMPNGERVNGERPGFRPPPEMLGRPIEDEQKKAEFEAMPEEDRKAFFEKMREQAPPSEESRPPQEGRAPKPEFRDRFQEFKEQMREFRKPDEQPPMPEFSPERPPERFAPPQPQDGFQPKPE